MAYLMQIAKYGSNLGLATVGNLLRRMGNPQDKLRFVHVAGTNGKGSIVAFISSVCIGAGYTTGCFTSPDIYSYNERVRVNAEMISDDDVARILTGISVHAQAMERAGEGKPTVFEVSAALAFQYFYERRCDVVALEVGLGGRLDATNIIKCPTCAVITSIGFDHKDRLGDTLSAIAYEKAGIIKPGGTVVSAAQTPEVRETLIRVCDDRQAGLTFVNPGDIDEQGHDIAAQRFDYREYGKLAISLMGDHQLGNAALAIEAIEVLRAKGFAITDGHIREGLGNTRWAGRFETLRQNPPVIVDGAHNEPGAASLRAALDKYIGSDHHSVSFIIGILDTKDYRGMIAQVENLAYAFYTVTPNNPHAIPAAELAEIIRKQTGSANVIVCKSVDDAIDSALNTGKPVCAFGSLYYIGEVRKRFVDQQMDSVYLG
jgi:dihydrofolate synthase/folylpolyglutamate synthase